MKNRIGYTLALILSVMVLAVACVPAPASPSQTLPSDSASTAPQPTPDAAPGLGVVVVTAPIESVEVIIAESFPPQYFLQVKSGLPNGCVRFNEYVVSRSDSEISVMVTNLEPADKNALFCTMVYGTVDSNIALGSDFDGGEEYTVIVNDVVETFTAQGVDTSAETEETVIKPAPIESVSISFKDGPVLVVVSGLPNSCYEFNDYALTRQGDAFVLDMNNVRPADESIMCVEIYRTVDTRIAITGEIEACKVYEVLANERPLSLQAIAPNVRCVDPAPESSDGPGYETVEVLAPIENLEIELRDGDYFASITSGLPGGCARFNKSDVAGDGKLITIKITNLMPAPNEPVPCTRIYGVIPHEISLGTDLEEGATYKVVVNESTMRTFTVSAKGSSGEQGPGYETVEVIAPIDSLKIDEQNGEYFALINSGLPSGCASFHDSGVTSAGNFISIKITNLQPAPGQLVACTAIYGIKSHRISLGANLREGVTYEVVVNESTTETFTVSANSSSGGQGPGYETVEVLAPIESLAIDIRDGRHIALVTSGLPSGCARFNEADVSIDGTLINVRITNLVPAPSELMPCTLDYRYESHKLSLDQGLEAGVIYTVVVNEDTSRTFTATAGNSSSGYGQTVDVRYGTTLYLDHLGLELTFADLLEDSRCPANVLCVWAGRARVLIGVIAQREDLGGHELRLEGSSDFSEAVDIGDYDLQLIALKPYPGTTGGDIRKEELTASMLVTPRETSDAGSIDDFEIILTAKPVQDRPLTMRFTADLVGGPDNSGELYCTGVTWEFGDGTGVAMMPRCVEWAPDVQVNRHIEQIYEYDEPGNYDVTLRLGPLPSETIAVQVGAELTAPY